MSGDSDSSKNDFAHKKFGTRHIQVFLMFLGVSLTCAGRFSISVALVAMTDANQTNENYPTYDWNSERKAYVLSSFFWGYVLMQIPCGIIADVHSAHKLVCAGVFVSSLINAFTPLAVSYFNWIGVMICRVLMGLTQSCLIPCTHTFISRWIPYEERSRLGILPSILFECHCSESRQTGLSLGVYIFKRSLKFSGSFALVGPQFGNVMTLSVSGWLASSSLGWPSIFYVFGVIGMIWAFLFYYIAADSPSKHMKIDPHERDYIEHSLKRSAVPENKVLKIPWSSMFTSIPVWTLVITHCGQAWGFQIFLTKLSAYIKYAMGYDIGQSGVISALPYVATLLLTFLFGWLCDFALRKNVPLYIVRKVSNTTGMWGASSALIILCLIRTNDTLVPLTILIVIVGLDAANFCGYHINHIDLAPNFAGAQAAVLNAAGIAFAQTAPIVCGYIVTDETNVDQWHIIFYVTAGLYFTSNLIFVTFGKAEIQSWN